MNSLPTRCTRARLASAAVFVLCLALAPVASQAQAWLPEKGAFSLSFDFSNILNKKHFTATGDEIDVGHTDLQILTIAGSYSPSDRVQVNASLPLVSSRYRGAGLGGHNTEIDNHTWHGTVTDLLLTAHYQLTTDPVAFAPYVGVIIPTHQYEVFGHSAPGRGLNEYWLGFYTAASLNEWIPRTYAQVRYNYAFVDPVVGISHDRSNASLEIGYFLNESVSVRALGSWQWTHGGIDVPVPVTSPLFPYHDRLAAEGFFNIGVGSSWTINERISVYGLYMHSESGKDGHKLEHRMSFGVTYGLGGH